MSESIDFPFSENNYTDEEKNINKGKYSRKGYGAKDGGWKPSTKRRNCQT